MGNLGVIRAQIAIYTCTKSVEFKSNVASLLFSGPIFQFLPIRKKVEFIIQTNNLAVLRALASIFTYTEKG